MKIWQTTDGEYRTGKYLVVRRDGTVPVWANFVIGAFDPCAGRALRAYAVAAKEQGYADDFVQSCYELADRFDETAATEEARKKADPDAPPHRTDLPEVIAMMRREYDLAGLLTAAQARSREDAEIMRAGSAALSWAAIQSDPNLTKQICALCHSWVWDDSEENIKPIQHKSGCLITKMRARADEMEGRTDG